MNKIISNFAVIAPVLALAALLLQRSLFSLSPLVIAAQAVAVGLAIWARRSFARGQFRVSAAPASGGLIKTGAFRVLRHPMYAAALLFVWAAILGHWSVANALIGIALVLVLLIRVPIEERLIQARYPEYGEYARTTKRVIPFLL